MEPLFDKITRHLRLRERLTRHNDRKRIGRFFVGATCFTFASFAIFWLEYSVLGFGDQTPNRVDTPFEEVCDAAWFIVVIASVVLWCCVIALFLRALLRASPNFPLEPSAIGAIGSGLGREAYVAPVRSLDFTFTIIAGCVLGVCAICIYWRVSPVSLAELPYIRPGEVYQDGTAYRVDPYIRAARCLQAMGQPAASVKLLAVSYTADFDDAEKIAVLCQMLFVQRHGLNLRRPMLGGASFIGGTAYSDWPLEPIEIVDGVPFDIVWGYSNFGAPPQPREFIRYCLANCDWSKTRFAPKTELQKKAALAKLIASSKWRKTLEKSDRDFFAAQIE